MIVLSFRNLDALIVEIYPILDTNAKRTLWPYIIQILPEEEQEVCKRKVIYLIDRHAAGEKQGYIELYMMRFVWPLMQYPMALLLD